MRRNPYQHMNVISIASQCMLARRMIERDVRFVQIFHRGWDQHFNVTGDLSNQCRDVGQPTTKYEDDAVHINNLNATILHQMGLDHHKFTLKDQGLDKKLTGVLETHVIKKILS